MQVRGATQPYICGKKLDESAQNLIRKMTKTAIYATKETIYLGYALPVQIKRP